jgi:hypothetical protein
MPSFKSLAVTALIVFVVVVVIFRTPLRKATGV